MAIFAYLITQILKQGSIVKHKMGFIVSETMDPIVTQLQAIYALLMMVLT